MSSAANSIPDSLGPSPSPSPIPRSTSNSTLNNPTTFISNSSASNSSSPHTFDPNAYLKVWPNTDDDNKYAKEIAEFREASKAIFEQYPDQELVREAQLHDRACVRYLRARKFVVPTAAAFFKDAVTLRVQQRVDRSIDSAFPFSAVQYNTLLCRGFHGYDKFDRPIYIERFGCMNVDNLYSVMSDEQRLAFSRYQAEFVRKVLFPRASERAGRRIDQLCVIVDMKHFGSKHIRTRQYSFTRALSSNDTLLYPERMAHTYLINTPSIFSFVWKIVSTWMDEAMKSKIQILSHSAVKELLANIDENQLPAILGGKCRCDGGVAHLERETQSLSTDKDKKKSKNKEKEEDRFDPDGCFSRHSMMDEFYCFCQTGMLNTGAAEISENNHTSSLVRKELRENLPSEEEKKALEAIIAEEHLLNVATDEKPRPLSPMQPSPLKT